MMPRLEYLESRDTPAGVLLASAGGWAYGLDPAGELVWSVKLDPGFDGPLHVAGLPDGDFLVGAGAGGGPRLSRFDGETRREEWSRYIGDPDSRTGVEVSALSPVPLTGEYPDLSPVRVVSHPASPAPASALTRVEQFLADLPDQTESWLAARGQTYYVYGQYGDGAGITVLPEWDRLRGKRAGDGRLYDGITAVGPVYPGQGVYLHAEDTTGYRPTWHETGHALQAHAPTPALNEWGDLWKSVRWERTGGPVPWYEALAPTEAWAEVVVREFEGKPHHDARIDAYLDRWSGLGWGVPV